MISSAARLLQGICCGKFSVALWSVCLIHADYLRASEAGESGKFAAEHLAFFEAKVRPLLVEKCYSCHSESANKVRGGLAVDSRQSLIRGGDTGPAIVPGKPDRSLLIEAIQYDNEALQMPPKGKLTDAEIATLTRWVQLGAPWPETRGEGVKNRRIPGTITEDDRRWWAFQPLQEPPVPHAGDGWAVNDIDRFIAAKHAAAGLSSAPEAERAVLIRRVYFDMLGLPPSPEEIAAFVADPSHDAYARLVERVLASPHYGERWARHWLDLVRYADSDGYRLDAFRPTAWRYRDYVIRSLNADKPYDRFVQEQLAGDELFPDDPDAWTATGYLRHWIYEYNQRDVRTQWDLILTDITDTTADVFLGLGLQCARCHDHKFDPLLQKDYFRLRAFFENILPRDDIVVATAAEKAAYARQLAIWEEKTQSLREEIEKLEAPIRQQVAEQAIAKFPEDIQAMIRTPTASRLPQAHQLAELAYRQVTYEHDRLDSHLKGEAKEKVLALRRELAKFDSLKPTPLPTVLAVTDVGATAPPTVIPKRPGEVIAPGILTILDPEPMTIPKLPTAPNSTGRRAALARWLTRPENPLTGRVIVNRIWQYHFGHGLAANASDFGRLGEPPSHPELLDWLVQRFIAGGWRLKPLHREILLSATYRQSAEHPTPEAGRLVDPENRLLWRGRVRRLDAEQIRDSLFSVTGELDLTAGGIGVASTVPRRSVYTKYLRNTRDPVLDAFDAPLWFQSASSRDTTTTPVQSLLLFNSPFMLERAKAFAARLVREEPSNESARVRRAYQLAFGRPPSEAETAAALNFLKEQPRRIDPTKAHSAEAAFQSGKIPYRDGQAADVKLTDPRPGFEVPHHERLPRGEFTIEAYVYPRSVAETGAVRTIAAKWSGNLTQPGWNFGITGKGSRRKPQTVVMQLIGRTKDGRIAEAALFSDHHVALNKPYYLAVAVRFATATQPGEAAFYYKDLANDDEPLLIARVPHDIVGELDNSEPLTIGSRGGKSGGFDGLIDDVRLSSAALGVDQLLFTHEAVSKQTVAFWQFEPKPSIFGNSAGEGLSLQPPSKHLATAAEGNGRFPAWVDLAHVLLNASEFLYVE